MVKYNKIFRIKDACTHSIIVRIDYYPISTAYVDYKIISDYIQQKIHLTDKFTILLNKKFFVHIQIKYIINKI